MLLFSWLGNPELDLSQICFLRKLGLLRSSLSLFEGSIVLTLVFKSQDRRSSQHPYSVLMGGGGAGEGRKSGS